MEAKGESSGMSILILKSGWLITNGKYLANLRGGTTGSIGGVSYLLLKGHERIFYSLKSVKDKFGN
jgi:hypothetical protein